LADRIADGGAVVNMSSRAQLGNVGQFNYAVSKGGVIGCTRALALAYAPRIRVNAVAPGFIESEMTAAMPGHVRERVIASVPLARAGQPSDIARTVRWLGSQDAGYVTGQVIYVCGGRSFG
jgi:3-oxoacyl-[acyl-carrier protein] reductase